MTNECEYNDKIFSRKIVAPSVSYVIKDDEFDSKATVRPKSGSV